MRELLTVVTRKGQITVPVEIRRALNLKEGDKVAFSISEIETGRVTLRPVRSVASLTFGTVKPRRQPEDFSELRDMFQEESVDEVAGEDSVGAPGQE